MKCRNCSKEIFLRDGSWVHCSGQGESGCSWGKFHCYNTVAEPWQTKTQRDIELLKNIKYRGDPGTTQGAVERLIAKIAEKLGVE
jgi:hypothetical protein